MGEVIYFFKKVAKKIACHFSFESQEIARIAKLPRYQHGETKVLGCSLLFVDAISFLGQYSTILQGHVYEFKTVNDRPYIIDCGANIGVSIIYFKTAYPSAEIIGFEPDKDIFAVLQKNISNRKYDDVTLINKGLWSHNGKMQFVVDGADGGSIIPAEHSASSPSEVTEIETTRLREYLHKKVDFLKIDIEGAESTVIEDCQDLLHNVDHIFIEYHSQVNVSQQLEVILSALAKEGFRYYIESAILKSKSPFIKRERLNNIENFLNIYAYKEAK